MAKQIATAKTSTVNQSAPQPHPSLSVYCKDFDDWPRRWMFEELRSCESTCRKFRRFLEQQPR